MISGDNGILKKVVQAKESTQNASVEERIRLAIQSAFASDYSKNGKITQETLIQELEKNGLSEENLKEIEAGKWVLSENGKEYLIYSDGNIEIKKGKLPLEYQELEYIESTGTQYIDTGVISANNLKIEAEFSITDLSASDNYIVGIYGGDYSGRIQFSYDANPFYGWGQNYNNISTLNVDTNKHTIQLTKDAFILDGNIVYIPTSDNFSSPANIYIFARNGKGTVGFISIGLKIYKIKISDSDNNIIRNFIPCKCITTVKNVDNIDCLSGTIGLYDMLEGKFYTNKETTGDDFAAGPEI